MITYGLLKQLFMAGTLSFSKCIATPVSTLDLTATITDLLSQWAPLPKELMEFAPKTDGKSLVPFLTGNDDKYERGPVRLSPILLKKTVLVQYRGRRGGVKMIQNIFEHPRHYRGHPIPLMMC